LKKSSRTILGLVRTLQVTGLPHHIGYALRKRSHPVPKDAAQDDDAVFLEISSEISTSVVLCPEAGGIMS
jgi:hypothetical protein